MYKHSNNGTINYTNFSLVSSTSSFETPQPSRPLGVKKCANERDDSLGHTGHQRSSRRKLFLTSSHQGRSGGGAQGRGGLVGKGSSGFALDWKVVQGHSFCSGLGGGSGTFVLLWALVLLEFGMCLGASCFALDWEVFQGPLFCSGLGGG